ncbi:hypothetical protein, variant 2 [Verruconis gallopava]|nr:hypothetical protein, variant 1 [Verruconis gallopava]XP_016216240.1 hypothetical protein, variant 2 [Verruconis gallopava]KIW06370.1 hypothetical protein, variant 1 [Verruconis gallopava]KIW06371.1 hypothetical protein, variant 2 [Verruconis gallopava]
MNEEKLRELRTSVSHRAKNENLEEWKQYPLITPADRARWLSFKRSQLGYIFETSVQVPDEADDLPVQMEHQYYSQTSLNNRTDSSINHGNTPSHRTLSTPFPAQSVETSRAAKSIAQSYADSHKNIYF